MQIRSQSRERAVRLFILNHKQRSELLCLSDVCCYVGHYLANNINQGHFNNPRVTHSLHFKSMRLNFYLNTLPSELVLMENEKICLHVDFLDHVQTITLENTLFMKLKLYDYLPITLYQ
jgi:hypothetical protein